MHAWSRNGWIISRSPDSIKSQITGPSLNGKSLRKLHEHWTIGPGKEDGRVTSPQAEIEWERALKWYRAYYIPGMGPPATGAPIKWTAMYIDLEARYAIETLFGSAQRSFGVNFAEKIGGKI